MAMAISISPRAQQIHGALTPYLDTNHIIDVVISYQTMFDDQETMNALNYLVKNLSKKVKINPTYEGYGPALAMTNKLYQALKQENFYNSCIPKQKMNYVEQVELAKRYSIIHLIIKYCRILQPVPQMKAIQLDLDNAAEFNWSIPNALIICFSSITTDELRENDLAQLVNSPHGLRIRCMN